MAATVSIEKVVKTGDAVPGRPFASVQFRGRASQLPGTINDAGVVAIQATSENAALQNDPILGTRQGIYVWIPGSPATLKVVADTTIVSVGGPGTFAVPGHPSAKFDLMNATPLLNNNGDVAFFARYSDPVLGTKFGLFSTTINGTTTSIVKIADSTDIVPGFAVPFSAFTSSSTGFVNLTLATLNDAGRVAFYATFDNNTKQGVFGASVSGGPIVRLADSSGTVVPTGQAQAINFVDLPLALNNAGNVVFHARLTNNFRGVFSALVTGGPVATVALQGQTAPGTLLPFGTTFTGCDVNSSGTVAFNNQISVSPFDQGDYFGDVNGGPRFVVADTLGGFPVPSRPATSVFDRLSFAGINDSQQLAFFARVISIGISNDQGIYQANGAGGPMTRIVDRGIVPPGLSAPAALTAFDPTIEGGSLTVAGGGSAAISDQGNLVLTATGVTAGGAGLRGIYFYDRCTPELVRIVDSTISPSAPPVGLGGTFSGGVQALFGFQNNEARSGYYRTINENNDVTFLGRFDGVNYGIYVAHVSTSGGGQLQIMCPPDVVAQCPADGSVAANGAALAEGCGTIAVSASDVIVPGCGSTTTIMRTWTADNGATTISCVQTISIVDSIPPVLSGVPDGATVQCDALPPLPNVSAADACQASVPVSLTETQVPGACPGTYVLTRTWTATDDCGNSTSVSQDVAVMDTIDPALMGVPGDTAVECDAVPLPASITASDTCDVNVPVVFAESQGNGSCPNEYTLLRTWTATDDCNNDVSATQIVTVDDTTAPTITCPPPASWECPADTSAAANGTASAVDNCGTVTISSADLTLAGCGATQTIKRTWTATDACLNTSTCDQWVSVADTTAPTLAGVPAGVTVECDNVPSPASPTATDQCDLDVPVSFVEIQTNGSCPGEYSLSRSWTATDDCGNLAVASQTVTVQDTSPPSIVVDTTPITVVDQDCSGSECVQLPAATVTDGCDTDVNVQHDAPLCGLSDTPSPDPGDDDCGYHANHEGHHGQHGDDDDGGSGSCTGFCFPTGTTTVTYSAMDDCGNTGTATKDVTVQYGANIAVRVDRFIVGYGSHPHTTKQPLEGIEVCAYDRSPGSCGKVVCGGHGRPHYQCILDTCAPVSCCTTGSNGRCLINLPPDDYLVIANDGGNGELPDPLAVSTEHVSCHETENAYLHQIVHTNGRKKPCKFTRLTGSELLVIEPEFVVWDDTVQYYPFVFETIGDWSVTATVVPPEGFVSDYDALSADVNSELESVQFAITEVGSDLVPTQTKFDIVHKGERKTVRSNVGILLTPEYARERGFDVAKLKSKGLIVEPQTREASKLQGQRAGGR